MSSSNSSSPSRSKTESNLESFLHSVTPIVSSKPLSMVLQQAAGEDNMEYFLLGDLWKSFDEGSAYGLGIPVVLNSGETIVQYYTPHLSALQLYTNRLSSSFTNKSSTSWNSDAINSSIIDDSLWPAKEFDPIGSLYFEFDETISPYWRVPFANKIDELVEAFPGLISLKSVDLSPASWMSVAWSPIYHLPLKGRVEDLSTSFLTFHTLSSYFQDTQGNNDVCVPYPFEIEEVPQAKFGNKNICLSPFGLSSLKMQGDVWINNVVGDYKKLIDLHCAADSWLKQLKFHHHDFDHYKRKNLEAGSIYM